MEQQKSAKYLQAIQLGAAIAIFVAVVLYSEYSSNHTLFLSQESGSSSVSTATPTVESARTEEIIESSEPETGNQIASVLLAVTPDDNGENSIETSAAAELPEADSEDERAKTVEKIDEDQVPASTEPLSATEFGDLILPSVLHIRTIFGSGTGFAIEGGFVLTSAHVVAGTNYVTVTNAEGITADALVVNRNVDRDFALLAVEGLPLVPLSFGDSRSETLTQGSVVYAFGYPLDLGDNASIRAGLVSRHVNFEDSVYLEISNAILPGDSGGPLINESGLVVGINNSALAESRADLLSGESLKLAIPIHQHIALLETLKSTARQWTLEDLQLEKQFSAFHNRYKTITTELFNATLSRINDSINSYRGWDYGTALIYIADADSLSKEGRAQVLDLQREFPKVIATKNGLQKATLTLVEMSYEIEDMLVSSKKRTISKQNGEDYDAYLQTIDEEINVRKINEAINVVNGIQNNVLPHIENLTSVSFDTL